MFPFRPGVELSRNSLVAEGGYLGGSFVSYDTNWNGVHSGQQPTVSTKTLPLVSSHFESINTGWSYPSGLMSILAVTPGVAFSASSYLGRNSIRPARLV